MIIRALVVDDQPVARERLVALLAAEPDVELAGTAATGGEAVRQIQHVQPDVVFLDLQMPELDGFGVIEAVGADRMPPTVFVTAHDEYALRAFDVHALDYLLKPFGRQRFQQAVQRVRHHLELQRSGEVTARLVALIDELKGPSAARDRLMVRNGGRVSFVEVAHIDWVEAEGNYVRLHAGPQSFLLRETLTALFERLGEHRFIRVHRSRLVNVARITGLRLQSGGDYEVVLDDGRRVGMSRMYRDAVQARLARS